MPPLDLLVAVVQLKALTSGGPSLSQVPNLVTRTLCIPLAPRMYTFVRTEDPAPGQAPREPVWLMSW